MGGLHVINLIKLTITISAASLISATVEFDLSVRVTSVFHITVRQAESSGF